MLHECERVELVFTKIFHGLGISDNFFFSNSMIDLILWTKFSQNLQLKIWHSVKFLKKWKCIFEVTFLTYKRFLLNITKSERCRKAISHLTPLCSSSRGCWVLSFNECWCQVRNFDFLNFVSTRFHLRLSSHINVTDVTFIPSAFWMIS